MEKVFFPASVVVFGVSAAPTNLGRNIVLNLQRFGFKGGIYAVGKDGSDVNGVPIFPAIEEVPGVPDLAVFLLPARHVPEALDACGRKGIRRAIIESGGFSEYADQGRDLEREVLDIARRWNMRVVGPNCISIVNLENGLVLPFVPLEDREIRKGNISIVAQSGGIALDCMRLLSYENLGASKLISMGNKLDVNENDFFEFLRSDPDTGVIGFYLEDVADGVRLMKLAESTEKPLIVLKANTNPASNHAARFHTAALAGDDEVVTAAFRQAGIHRVQNLTEMMESFKVFSLPVIKGTRLAVLGRSGGQAVLLADAVHRYGFELAKLSDDFFNHVRQHIRAGVIRMSNPLDMGDIFNIDAYAGIVEKALCRGWGRRGRLQSRLRRQPGGCAVEAAPRGLPRPFPSLWKARHPLHHSRQAHLVFREGGSRRLPVRGRRHGAQGPVAIAVASSFPVRQARSRTEAPGEV